MPRTKLYATDAERQQAYRLRRVQKASPCSPSFARGLASANPWPRWHRLAGDAEATLSAVLAEMEVFQESRSDRWQESEKAEDFADRLADLREVHEQLREWIAAR